MYCVAALTHDRISSEKLGTRDGHAATGLGLVQCDPEDVETLPRSRTIRALIGAAPQAAHQRCGTLCRVCHGIVSGKDVKCEPVLVAGHEKQSWADFVS